MIPTPEAGRLVALLSRAGNTHVHTIVTPLVTHAAMQSDFAWSDGWRLVRFWTKTWKQLTGD